MQKDVTIEIPLYHSIACAKAAMESLQRLRPGVNHTPAWTVNEDPAVRWRESSSATGSSIKTQTTLPVFHLEHRPAPTRQADEHHRELWQHRPEQDSTSRGTCSCHQDALPNASCLDSMLRRGFAPRHGDAALQSQDSLASTCCQAHG